MSTSPALWADARSRRSATSTRDRTSGSVPIRRSARMLIVRLLPSRRSCVRVARAPQLAPELLQALVHVCPGGLLRSAQHRRHLRVRTVEDAPKDDPPPPV